MVSREEITAMAWQLFEDYDKDNSGNLDRKEVRTIFDSLFNEIVKHKDYDKDKIDKLFTASDLDSDNKLTRK